MRTDVVVNRENIEKLLEQDFGFSPQEIEIIMRKNNNDLVLALNHYYKIKMRKIGNKLLDTPISDLPLADSYIEYISKVLRSQFFDHKTLHDLYYVAKGIYGKEFDPRTKELLLYSLRAIEIQLRRQETLRENFGEKMSIISEYSDEVIKRISDKRDKEGYIYLPTESFSEKPIKLNGRDRNCLYPIALYSSLSSVNKIGFSYKPIATELTDSLEDVILIRSK